jgi:hypothetical protein
VEGFEACEWEALEGTNGLHDLADLLAGLTSLSLDGGLSSSVGLRDASIGRPTALTDLNLAECVEVTDDGLGALASFTALTSLNLHGRDQVSDNGLLELAGLTALTTLNLAGCRVSDDGLRSLPGLTALTSLDLTKSVEASATLVSDGGLRALLAGLPSLDRKSVKT